MVVVYSKVSGQFYRFVPTAAATFLWNRRAEDYEVYVLTDVGPKPMNSAERDELAKRFKRLAKDSTD